MDGEHCVGKAAHLSCRLHDGIVLRFCLFGLFCISPLVYALRMGTERMQWGCIGFIHGRSCTPFYAPIQRWQPTPLHPLARLALFSAGHVVIGVLSRKCKLSDIDEAASASKLIIDASPRRPPASLLQAGLSNLATELSRVCLFPRCFLLKCLEHPLTSILIQPRYYFYSLQPVPPTSTSCALVAVLINT